jgi:hypothetical protein
VSKPAAKKKLCTYCGKGRLKTATLCKTCSQAHNASTRQHKAKQIDKGLCLNCTSTAEKGKRYCTVHLADFRSRRKAITAERKKNGLCIDCGAVAGGFVRCETCRNKRKKV